MITRAFDPSDDERVVDLYARLHAEDATIDALDLVRFRAFRTLSIFDDGRAFRVIEDDGKIIALLTVGKLESPRDGGAVWRTRAFVDPKFRRRGIATELIAFAERNARDANVRALESFVLGTWIPGRAFSKKIGFDIFIRDLFLSRSLDAFEAAVPRGISFRRYEDDRDAAIASELVNATLSRDQGFVPENAHAIAQFANYPGFELWFAERDGEAIGFCHTDLRGRVGCVQAIGVVAKEEGRGVGAALLSHGIETLRARAIDRIELCTEEDNVRAQKLYARAGFTFHRDAFTLRKRLS